MIYKLLPLLLLASLLTGCLGSAKTYVSEGDYNIFIHSLMDSGVTATVKIYEVDNACKTHDMGSFYLDDTYTKTAIKPNDLFYLVFSFTNLGRFLGGTPSTVSVETLFQAQPGERYSLKASYIDELYDVAIKSKNMQTKKVSELPIVPLSRCQKI